MADARTERWVAHRAEVRERLIDSAMRTIDTLGPQVTMQDLAAEAKIQKPTLYRFFTDKAELVRAILDRMRGQLHSQIVTAPAEDNMTLGDFVHSCIAAYLQSVYDHPNIFRIIIQMMSDSPGLGEEEVAKYATIPNDVATILRKVFDVLGGTGGDLALDAHMIVGCVMTGAHWWLDNGITTIEFSHLLDQVDKTVRAMIQATAHTNHIHIDFDMPIAVIFNTLSATEG